MAGITFIFIVLLQIIVSITWKAADAKGTERPRNPALFGDDNIGQAGDGHKPIPGISNGHLRDPAFFGGDMGRPARNKPIVGKGTGRPRNPALFGDDNIGQAGNGHKPIPGISNYQFSDPNYFGYDIGRPAGNKPIVGKGTERPRNPALFGDDNIGQAGNGHKPIPGISNGQVSDPTLFGYDIARTGNENVPFPGIGSESPRNPALSEDDNIGEYDDIE